MSSTDKSIILKINSIVCKKYYLFKLHYQLNEKIIWKQEKVEIGK